MLACSVPLIKKRRRSPDSEETFHQKRSVPGPVMIVWNDDDWLCVTGPLRPASTPSCATSAWPTQFALPPDVMENVVSNASGSGSSGVTESGAFELTSAPCAVVMTTE